MGVKSVIDIDVNDAAFKAFTAAFAKYDDMLKKMPDAWKDAGKAQQSQLGGFQAVSAAMMAQLELLRKQDKEEKEATRNLREQETIWQGMARSTASVAGNIAGATVQLLKWTALTSVFSGLIGAGGLFGIERLASGVSSGRRSSSGIGVTYGEQKSFDVNFGRVVDTSSFLSSVNEAQHDVTKRSALFGAGIGANDIANKDSAQLGAQLLGNIRNILRNSPQGQEAQTLSARQLNQFIGLQDAQRLRNMGDGEFSQLQKSYRGDQGSLGLTPQNQKVWQDFSTQMERAGGQIENVFVKGLTPLIKPLTDLSASITTAVAAFLSAPKLGQWITDLGTGLEKTAVYLGSDEFQGKVKSFVTAFGEVVDVVVKAAGGISKAKAIVEAEKAYQPPSNSLIGWLTGSKGTAVPGNNPGNLRPPGASTGFQSFATPEDGYKAMQRQLLLYQNRDGLNTVSGIVSKWAPPSENDTASYIGDVAKRSGLGATDKLDLNDPDQMSRLIAAMAHHENSKNNIAPSAVKIMITGAPGGNAVANAQQAATPGQ